MKLLVVDFDYFFPTNEDGSCPELGSSLLFDWGHNEGWSVMLNYVWTTRAAGFKRNGLPLPGLSGLQEDFWKRVNIKPKATLFYADSNAYASHIRVGRNVDEVWLFDAHHDSGYRGTYSKLMNDDNVSCEDWMCFYYAAEAKLHVRYPQWKKNAFESEPKPLVPVDRQFDDLSVPPVTFDRVFVCRSGAWVPQWVEDDYESFIERAPVQRAVRLDKSTRREWDPALVDQEIEAWEMLLKDDSYVD